jgi:4-amino-4-deoxy-L-arabinose transferase-like glycosyltransferase
MPHASEYHDDGIYYVSAKSLAETGTYAIESLPNRPPQTKYPPLFPAVLSLAWRGEPHYPDNLRLAMLLCWLWMPLTLLIYSRWLQLAGLSSNAILLLGALWALNPYVILFSTAMLSEMQFTFFLLAALVSLRPGGKNPEGLHWAAIAGVLAGIAFLTRTAGIALLPAAILFYGLGSRWKQLGLFAAGMVPPVLGWAVWSAENRPGGTDNVTLYYTNYFGHFLANFQWSEAHVYIWKNVDGMLNGLGAFLLPNTTQSLLDKVLAESLAIAGIIGVVRLVRSHGQSIYVPYAAFAACYALLLAVWYFPPTERFMLPVAPLWLAGFYGEMKRVAESIAVVFRKPERSQKIAGGLIAGLLALLLVLCGARQWALLTEGLPRFYKEHAERLEKSEPAMAWIRENLPLEARFLAENDPLLYLRTGRRGAGMFPPTIHWYREDQAARTAEYLEAASFARSQHLDYVLLNDWDWSRDMPADEHFKLLRALKRDLRLERIYASGPTAIYRIR